MKPQLIFQQADGPGSSSADPGPLFPNVLTMKRRLFLHSGSAAAVLAITGCGGGGGGADAGLAASSTLAGADPNLGDTATQTASPATQTAPAATQAAPAATQTAPAATQTAPTTTQTAPAQAPATATPTGQNLPSKILACYYTAWDTTYKITDVPMDFNVIYVFHATPAAAQNGTAEFKYAYGVSAAQVQTCRNRGQKVILTFGGAGLGFNFDTRTKSQNFVNSIQPIIASLGGVDGLDFNNFEANVGSSATEMIWIVQQLRAVYGSSFAITAPPNPTANSDMAMLGAMNDAGALTCQGGQYYDWVGFDDPAFIVARVDQWCNSVGADKTMVGFTSFNYGNGVSKANQLAAWATIKAKHPTIRGMFCWSAQLNLAGGNQWGSTMKPLVIG